MDNNQRYYVTYKFYDERGRRLSIFCIPGYEIVEEGKPLPKEYDKLFIWVIPCSSKDTFVKAKARAIFDAYMNQNLTDIPYLGTGVIPFQINVEEGKPKWSFLKWCEENYFKYHDTIIAMVYRGLWRGDQQLSKSPMVDTQLIPVSDGDAIPHDQSEN